MTQQGEKVSEPFLFDRPLSPERIGRLASYGFVVEENSAAIHDNGCMECVISFTPDSPARRVWQYAQDNNENPNIMLKAAYDAMHDIFISLWPEFL